MNFVLFSKIATDVIVGSFANRIVQLFGYGTHIHGVKIWDAKNNEFYTYLSERTCAAC